MRGKLSRFLITLICCLFINIYFSSSQPFFWEKTNDTLQSIIHSIIVNNAGDIYAAADANGVIITRNNGQTWVQSNNGLDSGTISYCLLHKYNDDIIMGANKGIFISRNGGDWEWIGKGLGDPIVNKLAVKPNGDLFAVTWMHGIYKSLDGGKNWNEANTGLLSKAVNQIVVKPNGDLFAATFKGVFISKNNGNLWTAINKGLSKDADINVMALSPNGDLTAGSAFGTIYHTTNDGQQWQEIYQDKDSTPVYSLYTLNDTTIIAGFDIKGIIFTVDLGKTWYVNNDGLYNRSIYALSHKEDFGMLAGTAGSGVFRGRENLITVSFGSSEFCAGNVLFVPFTIDYSFYNPNTFTAQLSDSLGNFNSPTNIGSIQGISSGIINSRIPHEAEYGEKYKIRVVSSNPRVISKPAAGDIKIYPSPFTNIIGNINVCTGPEYIYRTTRREGVILNWAVTGGTIKGDTDFDTILVKWDQKGTGKVKVYGESTITSCYDTLEINITVTTLPKPVITRNGMRILSNKSYGNQWFLDDVKIAGATKNYHEPEKTGYYSVQHTDSLGCISEMSDQFYFNIEGISDQLPYAGEIEVYPNPADGYLNIILPEILVNNSVIRLMTLTGETVITSPATSNESGNKFKMDSKELAEGMYILNIRSLLGYYNRKVIIKR